MATTTTATATQLMPGIGSLFVPSTSSSSTGASTLNANSFLTLFLAQLQNQDPTNPMQDYELASQLAQFTSVQELTQATTQLNNLQQYAAAINNAQITSLVGKNVTAQTSQISVTSGKPTALNYTLASPASVTYTIQDANGNNVYTGNLGSQDAGSYSIPWTGVNSSGNTVPDGAYTCTVTATASNGTSTTVTTTVQGLVKSCGLTGNPPTYLLSTGVTVPVDDVSVVGGS
ncbi:MAG TPA: FlgD immunoglobulin-like domain containing protein [Syntrophobacteraceae bacterium]|nr:FlgD immunoglobulin-like domain containing protein [Syntrophobacteraceae bacterium]